MKPELIFKIVAVILMGIAAVFYWQQNWDAAFASAVVGLCAFFLSIRFEAKSRVRQETEERQRKKEFEEEEEDSAE